MQKKTPEKNDAKKIKNVHTAITPKDLPVFNVKVSSSINDDGSTSLPTTSDDLKTFIRKFERVYLNNNVNVDQH